MATPANTTFVCCIEPGALEPMTLRLLESLRRHGGRFAEARFIACQPRLGPPLSRSTRQRLKELNGEFSYIWRPRKFGWYHYLNKAAALVQLNSSITTEWVTFLDSDTLIAREPLEFVADDVDFLACAPDDGLVGSRGPDDLWDATWMRIFKILNLDPAEVPFIQEHNTGKRIRLYFNSGAFSYRKETGFARNYLNSVMRILEENIGFPEFHEHYTDQVVLGLAALKMGIRWKALSAGYNLAVDRPVEELSDQDLASAVLLHYHKGLTGDGGALFARLHRAHPGLAAWLEPLGTIRDPRSPAQLLVGEGLRIARGVPRALYRRRLLGTLEKANA
jgi:hypothetical protein